MTKEAQGTTAQNPKKNRFLLIFICIFLGVAILFGTTLGIIIGVSEASAVASYNGIRVDRGTASYLASYYKYRYMSALSSAGVVGVRDTERFWSTVGEDTDGRTYGELLAAGTEGYIRGIIAANYLFSRYGSINAADETKINNAVREVLEFKADNDKASFNSLAEQFGFDYSSFRSAVELLYKANKVSSLLWGDDGSGLSNSAADCKAYLDTYSHVKLLFIRTENQLVTDSDGNQSEVPLSDEEKANRQALIAKIESEIEGIDTGADVQMSPIAFDNYISKHDEGVSSKRTLGYYFHENSAYTAEFGEAFPEVVDAALGMDIGEYAKVDTSIGACFIYRYEATDGDYLVIDDGTFSDFYSDGAAYMYAKVLEEFAAKVTVKPAYNDLDPVAIPYNSDLIVKFS